MVKEGAALKSQQFQRRYLIIQRLSTAGLQHFHCLLDLELGARSVLAMLNGHTRFGST